MYDYGEADPPYPPFLVLELVDGPSLAGLLARKPLDPAQVMDVVAQAAAGLQAAHRAGLVHRDIWYDETASLPSRQRPPARAGSP
jgi:serine/threonine-protein kinase